MNLHDLIVISDLHLGRGFNRATKRFHYLETFFFDGEFEGFCRWLCREAEGRPPFKLVLNGDTFDLLRIEPDPDSQAATARERRFGQAMTPQIAARTVSQILLGHPRFVSGLADVLKSGHEVVFLPGNHDLEVQWEPVRLAIREALLESIRSTAGEQAAQAAITRLRFEAWFHYEPGRIWIEHGCQYDPENAFRYPLRAWMAERPEGTVDVEQDVPLGNFVQRYLYNGFGNITFIVPSTRANARYVKWLLWNEPSLLARVLGSHVPFAAQLLRRLARVAPEARALLRDGHEREALELARSSGLGEKLAQISALKHARADAANAIAAVIRQGSKAVIGLALAAFVGVALWTGASYAISELQTGLGVKALLSVALNSLVVLLAVVALAVLLARTPNEPSPRPFRRAADEIARTLDVPIVTFGHTHEEVVWPLQRRSPEGAWYYNTGTWIAVFTHDVHLPRERVQFTFLRVRGHEAESLYWRPGSADAVPVVLLEE